MIQIDGIIFSLQKYGGISVCFRELLKRVHKVDDQIQLTLETPAVQTAVVQETSGIKILERKARFCERYRDCRVERSSGSDIFHSSYYRNPSDSKMPTVVTVHDFVYERMRSGMSKHVHHYQKMAAIARAQAIICVSESTRQDLLEFGSLRSGQIVSVVHNGVSSAFYPLPKASELSTARPYVLYVGQREGYKNFNLALRALECLPEVELLCVGGGPLVETEFESLSSANRSRVVHAGCVEESRLNELYNNAVCLLYPSSYEGFGIPVVEAMRAGCPVVSTACRAVMEVGGDALCIAEPDGKAIAETVSRIAFGRERETIRQRGYGIAARYSWDVNFERIFEVYQTLDAAFSWKESAERCQVAS